MSVEIGPIITNILTILILVILLVKSADFVSEAFVFIAKRAGVSEFIVGFLVLGFVTSLPEISVAINSVSVGVPELTIGNLLGGSFVLITLVIGLNALVHRKLEFDQRFKYREVLSTLAVIFLPILVLIDQNLSSSEGLILIIAYGALGLNLYAISQRRKPGRPPEHKEVRLNNISASLIKTAVGIAGLIFLSDLIVDTAVSTASLLHIPIGLIGLFLLSIGTNLPELTILFRARTDETEKFAVGDFLGSASINTAIIGLVGILAPYSLPNFINLIPVFVLSTFAILLFSMFSKTHNLISGREGVILISVYISMILIEVIYVLIGQSQVV